MAQIQLRNKNNPVVRVDIRLAVGKQSEDKAFAPVGEGGAYDNKPTDFAGNLAWPNPLPSNSGYTLWVNYGDNLPEYQKVFKQVDNLDNDIVIEVPLVPITRVTVANNRFQDETGKEFKWIFGTHFMLHQLVAEGIDIRPLLYQGLNGYRVFGSMHWIPSQVGMQDFDPANYSNWGTSLEQLADILFTENKYMQYNVLCDRQYLPGDLNKMKNMVGITNEIAKNRKNIICALGNENFKNGFNADDFSKPIGAIWNCGSGATGGPAPLSNGRAWDYQCQHLRRDGKMFIDIPPVEAPTYPLNNVLLFDETIGFADFDSSSRSSRVDWAYQMGAGMRAFYGGVCHLNNGVHSKPLGNRENECKDAFVRGMTHD